MDITATILSILSLIKATILSIKDWLIPISSLIASIAGLLALREYKLKVRAENRLTQSAEIEADIKLLKLFTEIMDIAHSRKSVQFSEKALERILSPDVMKELGLSATNIQEAIKSSVINLPVGIAAQDAAISAIWVLGNRHEVLKPVAIQGLKSLTGFKKKVATPYLEDLEKNYKGNLLATADHEK